MESNAPDLKILDEAPLTPELNLVSEVFHQINRILPEDQELLTVSPDTKVREAVSKMTEFGYSQVPVALGDQVLGIFSYRSFASKAAAESLEALNKDQCAPGDLPVDEFLEEFQFARVTDELQSVFSSMDRDNGILIGSPDRLQGVLTPMDFLRYLYEVASPFVMLSEIELALRELINSAVDEQELRECIEISLAQLPGKGELPETVADMSFDNYKTLIADGRNWAKFHNVFGGTRARINGKLKEIRDLRNDLFHFKRELTDSDRDTLAGHRDWILNKARQADAARGGNTK